MVKFDATTIAVKQVKRRIKVKMEKIRRLSDISKDKVKRPPNVSVYIETKYTFEGEFG